MNDGLQVYWAGCASGNDLRGGFGILTASWSGGYPRNESGNHAAVYSRSAWQLACHLRRRHQRGLVVHLAQATHVTEVLVCDPRKNALLKVGNKGDRIDAT